MARALFPDDDPIGRSIGGLDAGNRNWAEIVGVIPDQRSVISATTASTQFQVFKPLAQETWNYATVAIRASNAAALADPLRRIVAELDPDLPVQQLGTLEQQIELGASAFHLTNIILVAFSLLGLFLTALGLYGVISRLVIQRTPEIGVRVALGAQSRDVLWLVLRSGLQLTILGTVLGLLASVGLVQVINGFLPDMGVQDPVAIGSVTLLLIAIALLACWLPARRATRVNPIDALRAE
jgi:ABC-type antimicrobial peptide transport system permease subunit